MIKCWLLQVVGSGWFKGIFSYAGSNNNTTEQVPEIVMSNDDTGIPALGLAILNQYVIGAPATPESNVGGRSSAIRSTPFTLTSALLVVAPGVSSPETCTP